MSAHPPFSIRRMSVSHIVCAALIFSLSLGGCAPMHSTLYSGLNDSSSSQDGGSFLGSLLLRTAVIVGLAGLIAVLDDESDKQDRHDKHYEHGRRHR